jgi:hypothetical protein
MTVGTSLLLIAVGAILRYAVTTDVVAGINLDVAGLILMIAGVVGLVIGLWLMFAANRGSHPPSAPPPPGAQPPRRQP